MSAFPLQTVLELMQKRTDDSARTLGRLIAAEQSEQGKLDLLNQYRQEYTDRFSESARIGITPGALANYQAFLAKIDEAIAHQQRVLDQSKQATVTGQQQWLAHRNRVKAIDSLAQRHVQILQAKDAKRDQKQTDELSTRQFLARNEANLSDREGWESGEGSASGTSSY